MLRTRIHPAWFVAATAFVALIGSAGFRAAPDALFTGSYTWARVGGAGLCSVAAVLSYVVRKPDVTTPSMQPAQM